MISQASTSAFSAALHSRPTTSLQLRRNHFSVLALSAKRSGLKAGANGAITQMFFNSDAYFRFVDEAYALGADIPVVPGIMPITNASGIMRFADSCGTEIPRWIRLRLQGFGDDTASIKAFGLDIITDLCDQLHSAGVPGIHFYTMNQAGACSEIIQRLRLA